MANTVLLGDTIAHLPDFAAWDSMFSTRFSVWPIDNLLIYLVDTVDASALPAFAYQFDILGYEGWNLCTTDDQRRALIKTAIALKKKKGSVWSVKQALITVGYGDATIDEGVDGSWAKFRLSVDLGSRALNASEIDNVVQMVNLYKPQRCLLADILYQISFDDSISIPDAASVEPADDSIDIISAGASRICDGEYIADGSIDASLDADILIIQIV